MSRSSKLSNASSSTPLSTPRGSGSHRGVGLGERGGIQLLRQVQRNNARQWQKEVDQLARDPGRSRNISGDSVGRPTFPSHFVYDGQFPPNTFYRGSTNASEDEPLKDARFIDSITTTGTTASTADTDGTFTTVRVVGFREPIGSGNDIRRMPNALDMNESVMTTSFQVDKVTTSDVLLAQPQTTLLLTCIQIAISIQILVTAVICKIYGWFADVCQFKGIQRIMYSQRTFLSGCPLYTSLWCSALFIINGSIDILFLRVYPKWRVLQVCIALHIICLLATVFLFMVTTVLLAASERTDFRVIVKQVFDGTIFATEEENNALILGTQIAMYSLHLILTPVYGVCGAVLLYLLVSTYRGVNDGDAQAAYFLSAPPGGHQQVLVPIQLHQVKEMPKADLQAENMVTVAVQTVK